MTASGLPAALIRAEMSVGVASALALLDELPELVLEAMAEMAVSMELLRGMLFISPLGTAATGPSILCSGGLFVLEEGGLEAIGSDTLRDSLVAFGKLNLHSVVSGAALSILRDADAILTL